MAIQRQIRLEIVIRYRIRNKLQEKNVKQVLIVTKIGKNYGALLQAYALKTCFENRGCSVSVLNYCLESTMQTYEIYPKITGKVSFIRFLKAFPVRKETQKSVQRFLLFRQERLNLTREYQNYAELEANAPDADIYVTGSDQVWNPKINFDRAYYLQFGRKDAVRASYAASIGLSQIPKEYEKELVDRIKQIPFRSVRESIAQKILQHHGISSNVHVDPTILLDKHDYDQLAVSPSVQKPYVLLYLLIMPDNVKEYLDELRKLYPNFVFVNIPGNTYTKPIGDVQIRDIGPCEFLGLIRNAEAVLTTSFHGTVFSLIYQKQFMSVLPHGTGSRISELLEKVDLEKRIAFGGDDVKRIQDTIDYEKVDTKIEMLRQTAFNYIDRIVAGNEGGR